MSSIKIDIVSAEGEILAGTADMVFAPAEQGEVGIAPRHAPLITRLKAGEVRVQKDGTEQSYFVSGGILEVQPHAVTVLADTAIRAKDLDEAAALEAKKRAEEALASQKTDFDVAKAQAELVEAAARLQMIQRLRQRTKA
jgi:F-type H+-transporting ATPase subunit epsilon